MAKLKINRIGEEREFIGGIGRIIEYTDKEHIKVEFQDKYKYVANSTYDHFKKANIINPYYPYNKGIGYIGNSKSKENGKKKDSYNMWNGMLERCYSKKYQEKYSTYIDCSICEEWHSYEFFEKWYNENYYKIGSEKMNLDKDILFKKNKLYSPNTCCIVPQTINKLFTKTDKLRNGLIGTYLTKNGKYLSQCQTESKTNKGLGLYSTELEAFIIYKKEKEAFIKRVADRYKQYIPNNVYKAMYNYEVDIDD